MNSNNLGNWPFLDPPNVAVIASVRLLEGKDWVHYVTHDEDDGAWQFHPFSGPTTEAEAAVVSLAEMLRLEPRIRELADLPTGWHAWRDKQEGQWFRSTIS